MTAVSSNVAICAAAASYHVKSFSDRESDDAHRNDLMRKFLSHSERFGIYETYFWPSKAAYLFIVHHLADQRGIELPLEELDTLID